MAAKLIAIYPRPKDVEAMQKSLASPGGQETAAHAVSISSGGPPIFLVAEEETFTS